MVPPCQALRASGDWVAANSCKRRCDTSLRCELLHSTAVQRLTLAAARPGAICRWLLRRFELEILTEVVLPT